MCFGHVFYIPYIPNSMPDMALHGFIFFKLIVTNPLQFNSKKAILYTSYFLYIYREHKKMRSREKMNKMWDLTALKISVEDLGISGNGLSGNGLSGNGFEPVNKDTLVNLERELVKFN